MEFSDNPYFLLLNLYGNSQSQSNSQSLRVLSKLPERANLPSGEKQTEYTEPARMSFKLPQLFAVSTSQSLRVSSPLPERAYRPSGEKQTEFTG